MVVRMRLARFGRVNQPFYNIVVANARTARNSKPIEVIGTYDPVPKRDPYDDKSKPHKDVRLDSLRAKYWIGVGAQPTDTVWRLLAMANIIEPKFRGDGTPNRGKATQALKETPVKAAKKAAKKAPTAKAPAS